MHAKVHTQPACVRLKPRNIRVELIPFQHHCVLYGSQKVARFPPVLSIIVGLEIHDICILNPIQPSSARFTSCPAPSSYALTTYFRSSACFVVIFPTFCIYTPLTLCGIQEHLTCIALLLYTEVNGVQQLYRQTVEVLLLLYCSIVVLFVGCTMFPDCRCMDWYHGPHITDSSAIL